MVRFEMQGTIGVATLSDVPKRNALSRAIVRGMFDAIEASRRHGARALVLTGDGSTFCAGANIGDLRDGWMDGTDPATDPMRLFEALTQMPRVVVAAVNGPAVGGGFELTLSCDLVVAHRDAWFALPELGHGVIPNTALARLQQIVGMRRAFELTLTRRRVGAEEALALGLVTEVVDGDARQRAVAMADDIVAHAPPGAIAVAKAYMNEHARTDWERVRASLGEVPAREWREGLDAFTERRAVDFEKFWRMSDGIETR
jgi:enoyl-CoA hydratase/carnithine racemase